MIDANKVAWVYIGELGKCCCGCAGAYSYAYDHRHHASKERGYDVALDEVNEAEIRRVTDMFLMPRPTDKIEEVAKNHWSLERGQCLYMLGVVP